MNKQQQKISAVITSLIISTSVIYLCVFHFPNQVFIGLCFITPIIGFLPPYLSGGKYPMHKTESYKLSFITLTITQLAILILTYESWMFLTLLVVTPFMAPIVWLFSYLAFKINDRRIFKVKDFFRILVIVASLGLNL